MNKMLIGFTLIATTALGCDCPEEKVCEKAECPDAPELQDVPGLAAQQARSIELHVGGKTYPGALLGDDQLMLNFMGSDGTMTTVFYSLGGSLKSKQWDPASRLHLMLNSEVGSLGFAPGALPPELTKLPDVIARSALQRGPKGLVSVCQDLQAACGNVVAKLPPDISPKQWKEFLAIVEERRPLRKPLRLVQCGSTFGECAEGLTCSAKGEITRDGVKTEVDCCAKPQTNVCAPPAG